MLCFAGKSSKSYWMFIKLTQFQCTMRLPSARFRGRGGGGGGGRNAGLLCVPAPVLPIREREQRAAADHRSKVAGRLHCQVGLGEGSRRAPSPHPVDAGADHGEVEPCGRAIAGGTTRPANRVAAGWQGVDEWIRIGDDLHGLTLSP